MSETFYLEIITVEHQFYIGQSESVVLPILDGEYGIWGGHEYTITAITPGNLKFKVNGEWKTAIVSDGYAEITPDYVVVLVSSAERPEDIDIRRAEDARQRAEEKLQHKQSVMEYYNSKASLARAMARLEAAKRL